jgi:NAD(P)-dependent dehydrogenase (short-subunit alcohol dehydrogenase family)
MLFDGLLWMAISNSMPGLDRFRDAHLDALGQRVAEEFRRVTEGNLPQYVHGTMAALSQMQARNQGALIQTGSTLAYRGIPEQDAYCGAKYAIHSGFYGFTTLRAHSRWQPYHGNDGGAASS